MITMQEIEDEVLLKLGNGIVKVELTEEDLMQRIIQAAFRELQRYINITKYATVPFYTCIDLSTCEPGVQSVTQVMRTKAGTGQSYDFTDALYLAATAYPGVMDSMTDYRSYLRTRQVKNTLSGDLSFIWDESTKRLYISATYPVPSAVTIAYIPLFKNVEDLNNTYWEDILIRLSLALAKETLGRARGKYVLQNALYNLDADQLLSESKEELTELRTFLTENSDLVLPID